MLLDSPIVTGSIVVSGSTIFGSSLNTQHQFTGSVSVTGSLSLNGSNVVLSNQTSSMYVLSASYAANSDLLDGRDSLTFANTGSNSFVGQQNINGAVAITGSLTTTGIITAQTLNVQQVTSSIVYSSGSNIFGNSVSNTQSMTGSVGITGSLSVNGSLTGTSATFTAAVTPLILKGTNASTMYTEYYYNTSTLSGYIGSGTGLLTGANTSDFIIRSEADFVVATGGNNRRLTIASTGAATFSGALSGTSATFSSAIAATSYITLSNPSSYATIYLTQNPTNATADTGGEIIFRATYRATADTTEIARIRGLRDNATGGAWAGYLAFYTSPGSDSPSATTERMRITSGGNVLIGRTTSGLTNTEGTTITGGSIQVESTGYIFYGNRTTSDGLFIGIRRNNVDVGSITVTTSATAFNTSSDYRLKTDFKDYNGLNLINSIKTYDYAWVIDNTRAYGVKAHELAEVIPNAVFGEKDEINEDGSVKSQAVDYSKLVPILVKAIQELKAEIDLLKNK